jgi:hypothetical protein
LGSKQFLLFLMARTVSTQPSVGFVRRTNNLASF